MLKLLLQLFFPLLYGLKPFHATGSARQRRAGCVVKGSKASLSLIVAADVRIDSVLAYAPCQNRSYDCSFHCSMVWNRSVPQPDNRTLILIQQPALMYVNIYRLREGWIKLHSVSQFFLASIYCYQTMQFSGSFILVLYGLCRTRHQRTYRSAVLPVLTIKDHFHYYCNVTHWQYMILH